jgi:superfamily I DNA/RNA helicase
MLDLNGLNPQQRQAVETLRGPVLILAGAGTGKTRVITQRVAHLIAKGVAPEHILAVTFTNKAAREMQERVTSLLRRRRPSAPEPDSRNTQHATRPTICTFHSLCVRILRQHSHRLGYKNNFVIFSESDQLGAIKKILSQISAKGEKTDPHAILGLLSRYRNGGERAAVFADASVAAMAEHVRARYESALRACNAVDFDDLILLTLRLFEQHPDALAACRDRYRYVMVDEYQDTNAAQFRLVHALTQEHRNLCVVGDDDQSIYGWRGAEIANLLDLEKHYPEVKIIKLEQNYRSTNTILTAANALIRNNVRRRGKRLWSQNGPGTKIVLHTFANEEEEARTVVEEIECARFGRRVPWSEQAILFRTNAQSRPLETALRQAGVRYHLIGGQSFFDRREIKDFLAYLKVFLNPRDDVSLLRIANVPPRGLSDVTMERLLAASHERHCSVFEAMKNPVVQAAFLAKARENIAAFVEFIERTRGWLSGDEPARQPKPLQLWAEEFLTEIGYWDDLRRGEKDAEAAENRLRNLRDLIATMDDATPESHHLAVAEPSRDAQAGRTAGVPARSASAISAAPESPARTGNSAAAAGADARAPRSGQQRLTGAAGLTERLQAFLDELTLDSEREEEEEARGDAVTLITMHSCKGLEFPHVHVVGLEDGLLPHSRSKAEGTLDEERRLFYVAITRAMKTLSLSFCTARKKYGELTPCHPSPFLKELPPELIEDAAERGKKPVAVDAGKGFFAAVRAAVG